MSEKSEHREVHRLFMSIFNDITSNTSITPAVKFSLKQCYIITFTGMSHSDQK